MKRDALPMADRFEAIRNRLLWTLPVLYALSAIWVAFGPTLKAGAATAAVDMIARIGTIVAPTLFAALHGTRRLGIRTMIIFFAIAFVVSWTYESLSITTGFPFGHYYYTGVMGLKVGLVPIMIMFSYFSVCYLSWHLAHILLGKFDANPDALLRFPVPLVASFIMVMWDMSMDPARSTLNHAWIWRDGGSYFGVPFSNFMGWFLCVYTIFQLLALYLVRTGAPSGTPNSYGIKGHWHQPTAMYGAVFIEFVAFALWSPGGTVTDAAGQVWGVRDMHETLGLVAIFTMLFVTCLAFFKVQANENLLAARSSVIRHVAFWQAVRRAKSQPAKGSSNEHEANG